MSGLSPVLSKFQFDTGSGLTDIVDVISCETDFSRAVLIAKPIGVGYQQAAYGSFALTGTVTILYRKSNHQAITDQIVLASASKSCKVISQTGDEYAGNCKIENLRHQAAQGDFQLATFVFHSDGAWTINGQATV